MPPRHDDAPTTTESEKQQPLERRKPLANVSNVFGLLQQNGVGLDDGLLTPTILRAMAAEVQSKPFQSSENEPPRRRESMSQTVADALAKEKEAERAIAEELALADRIRAEASAAREARIAAQIEKEVLNDLVQQVTDEVINEKLEASRRQKEKATARALLMEQDRARAERAAKEQAEEQARLEAEAKKAEQERLQELRLRQEKLEGFASKYPLHVAFLYGDEVSVVDKSAYITEHWDEYADQLLVKAEHIAETPIPSDKVAKYKKAGRSVIDHGDGKFSLQVNLTALACLVYDEDGILRKDNALEDGINAIDTVVYEAVSRCDFYLVQDIATALRKIEKTAQHRSSKEAPFTLGPVALDLLDKTKDKDIARCSKGEQLAFATSLGIESNALDVLAVVKIREEDTPKWVDSFIITITQAQNRDITSEAMQKLVTKAAELLDKGAVFPDPSTVHFSKLAPIVGIHKKDLVVSATEGQSLYQQVLDAALEQASFSKDKLTVSLTEALESNNLNEALFLLNTMPCILGQEDKFLPDTLAWDRYLEPASVAVCVADAISTADDLTNALPLLTVLKERGIDFSVLLKSEHSALLEGFLNDFVLLDQDIRESVEILLPELSIAIDEKMMAEHLEADVAEYVTQPLASLRNSLQADLGTASTTDEPSEYEAENIEGVGYVVSTSKYAPDQDVFAVAARKAAREQELMMRDLERGGNISESDELPGVCFVDKAATRGLTEEQVATCVSHATTRAESKLGPEHDRCAY